MIGTWAAMPSVAVVPPGSKIEASQFDKPVQLFAFRWTKAWTGPVTLQGAKVSKVG